MAKNRGSKEGFDPSVSMPVEKKNNEGNKQKIAKIHDMFPMTTKDNIAKILQYYDDEESSAINALTSDGGKEALSNWTESGNLKTKNNKNKRKKKKGKKDTTLATSNTASFDADDSSSIHSGYNLEIEAEKSSQATENGNGIVPDTKDTPSPLDKILSNQEHISNNEATKPQITEPEIPPHKLASSSTVSVDETNNRASVPSDYNRNNSVESESRVSPVSDNSEKLAEQGIKKDKFRSINEGHNRHSPRQRTSSFRRNKSSSISEDSSSQTNPQAAAAPSKRGFEKCKKDLQRQTASLQRINAQLDKGFEDSEKRLKNAFADILTKIENRQKELEQELTRRKIEAFELLRSRQELCAEYKKRTDRTSSLTEAEWSELRSDIKQFVTERKYDDDLGKTIWFQWPDISETIQTFGEVCPVKNVYSHRSHSGNEIAAASNHPEPSPSSSVANEEIASSGDRNDVANIADAVEDESHSAEKEETPAFTKPHQQLPPQETRSTRIYQNRNYGNQNRFHQNNPRPYPNNNNQRFFRGNRGSFNRPYPRNNYNNNNYRQNYEDNTRDFHPNPTRGYRSRGGGRYNNNNNSGRNFDNKFQRSGGNGPRHNAEHSSAPQPNVEKSSAVNGFDGSNNDNNN